MFGGIKEKNIKDSSVIMILAFFVLTGGIILGSMCLMKANPDTDEGLKTYLNNFLLASQSGMNKFGVFKSAILENAFYLVIVFAAGFFRVGIIFIAAALVRKGFIMGFTAAAFVKMFGIKGILVTSSMLPSIILLIPAFIVMSAASVDLSLGREKKIIASYVFLAIVIMLVFCVAALSEGYLTTVFMKWLSPKIIN